MTAPVQLATALQLCPFSPGLESELKQRFRVIRWFELNEGEQTLWLARQAEMVRAVVSNGNVGCPSELMQALPRLGILSINGVGVDKVDLDLAKSRGVRVTTTPGTLTDDVADLAVGLIISLLREIPAADRFAREGRWPRAELALSRKVSGRHFGIVGLGNIGLAIARRLAPFGRVSYHAPAPRSVPFEYQPDLQALARDCSILVLACSANASTRRMIGAAVLDALGPEGYLVNVARGSLVDEPALIAALESGRIAGAALDVFENEPHIPDALRNSARVVLTPHVASATVQTRKAMADLVLKYLDEFLKE